MKKGVFSLLLCFAIPAFGRDCVILLHGLGRSSASMSTLEKALQDNHYSVVNSDYPSRAGTIEEITAPALSNF